MKESAEYILNNSDLLIRTDCKIVNNILYERLRYGPDGSEEHDYRSFISCDDYDYVEDPETIAMLDALDWKRYK